jgi:hypothetical protein
MTFPYDFFLSNALKDNQSGWVKPGANPGLHLGAMAEDHLPR